MTTLSQALCLMCEKGLWMHDATDIMIWPTSAILVCVVCEFPVPWSGGAPAGMQCLLLVSCNPMHSCTTTCTHRCVIIASLCLCCKAGTLVLCIYILGELMFDI